MTLPTLTTARLTPVAASCRTLEDSRAVWADPLVVRHVGGRAFTEEESWTRLMRARGLYPGASGFWLLVRARTATGRLCRAEVGFADLRRDLAPSLCWPARDGLGAGGLSLHGQGLRDPRP
ncbi:hypothetical protein ACRAWD_25225 [Caulobacter segnis]